MKFAVVILSIVFSISLAAEDWPAFRGPHFNGVSGDTGFPLRWDRETNVLWKVGLPGECNGSPVVADGKVFVVSAIDQGRKRSLHCFDRNNGAELWVRTIEYDKVMPTHKTNLYGGSTPVAAKDCVVVWHGSAGLFCYDYSGTEIWQLDLGEFRHMWGYGGSPIIHDDKVFLNAGPGERVYMVAVDLTTGKLIWKTEEPVDGNGERNTANKYMGSWSTPVIAEWQDEPVVLCSFSTRVNAYRPETGEIVFSCEGLSGPKGDLCYTSTVIAGDICVAMGGFGGPTIGFRMVGEGDITAEQRLWRVEKNPQRIGSGVVVGKHLYMANAGPNLLECIEPETGTVIWKERSPGGACWGSMVHADGRIYTTDQQGTTHVIRPDPNGLEILAANQLNERSNSTPAFSDGQIFIRTFENLYCISDSQ